MELLRKLWLQHGPLMFHQSGGCCDGSSPMCYPAGEFITGDSDVQLGLFDISDGLQPQPMEFWMSREQFNYWSHTHLTVDVVPGRGSGFSVEAPGRQAVPDPLDADGLARLSRSRRVRADPARGLCGDTRSGPRLSASHYVGQIWPSSGWTLR